MPKLKFSWISPSSSLEERAIVENVIFLPWKFDPHQLVFHQIFVFQNHKKLRDHNEFVKADIR